MASLPRCELVSWARVHALCRILAKRIRADGFRPDLIVAIGRGGWMPGRVLSDLLGLPALMNVRVEHYRGAHKDPVARVTQPLAVPVSGLRILLVDDVSDTGDTFEVAGRHLRETGAPAEVRTAVMHHKVVSRVVPDYYARKILKWRWIVYPWAVVEDLSAFARQLEPPPADAVELGRRLAGEAGIRVGRAALEDVWALLAEGGG